MFSQLTGSEYLWRKGLEGFAFIESNLMREARNEGRINAKQEMLERFLRLRVKPGESIP